VALQKYIECSVLALQLIGTVATLILVPSNLAIAVILPCWWVVTFRRVRAVEFFFYAAICLLFTFMDAMAVKQGVFAFNRPDIFGLPFYEPLMWGFYVLHTTRVVGGVAPQRYDLRALACAIPFAATFSYFTDPHILLCTSGAALALALVFFHHKHDLHYMAYMIAIGAIVEYAGVWSGQWHYPKSTVAVPLWFITMWGGIGLFARRLVLPELCVHLKRESRHAGIASPTLR
jgi:hypothetical protein